MKPWKLSDQSNVVSRGKGRGRKKGQWEARPMRRRKTQKNESRENRHGGRGENRWERSEGMRKLAESAWKRISFSYFSFFSIYDFSNWFVKKFSFGSLNFVRFLLLYCYFLLVFFFVTFFAGTLLTLYRFGKFHFCNLESRNSFTRTHTQLFLSRF